MVTSEQPLTRSELRAELDSRLQHYATKADLERLKADLTWRMVATQFLGLTATAAIVAAVAAVARFLG